MPKQVWKFHACFFMHKIGLSSASGIGVVTGKAGRNTVFHVWMTLSANFFYLSCQFAYHSLTTSRFRLKSFSKPKTAGALRRPLN
jgi:hypothetical protein